MSWGQAFTEAYEAASAAAREAATTAMSSARAAADAVRNVASFGARAAGETATAAGKGAVALADRALEAPPLIGDLYKAAKARLAPTPAPRPRVVEPCPNSLAGKYERLRERERLVALGRGPGGTPAQQAAAERLARNNQAVELAKLSADTYAQYGKPPVDAPPLGWSRVGDAELMAAGIDPALTRDAKAVVYRTGPDWPGGQRTVLAFRGTVPSEADDLKTNYDQALGLETVQYSAASKLGRDIGQKFGPDVLVTGHSLGGGKAQAAGVAGGLSGSMFNAAGLNPDTVGGAPDDPAMFTQYRTPGDPLTGLQNSAALQAGLGAVAGGLVMPVGLAVRGGDVVAQALGLPVLSAEGADLAERGASAFPRAMGNLLQHGTLLPPAIGPVVEVPCLDDAGNPVPMTDLLGQHSGTNIINGIEREKSEDVATLKGAS